MTSTNIPKIIICVIATLQLFFISVSYADQFEVVRVYDGDTLKAVGYDIEIKDRLVGIDAPETSKRNMNQDRHTVSRLKNSFLVW